MDKEIIRAKKILNDGNLVIFPTETVYGLGADATNSKAIKKIYDIKKRPHNNPIICHFHSLENIEKDFFLSENAYKLASKFWPGPLTLILKKRQSSLISPLLSNKKDYVGCRIPKHSVARKLLEKVNFPIAAPSANLSTKLSSTHVDNISIELKNKVFVLNGGISFHGLESTVINICNQNPEILRLGSITIEEISKIIPNINHDYNLDIDSVSPGSQKKHYSPNLPIRINVKEVFDGEALLNFGSNKLKSRLIELNLSIKANLKEAGRNLYKYLHKLDKSDCDGIAVAPIPNHGLGKTINDRLSRASNSE